MQVPISPWLGVPCFWMLTAGSPQADWILPGACIDYNPPPPPRAAGRRQTLASARDFSLKGTNTLAAAQWWRNVVVLAPCKDKTPVHRIFAQCVGMWTVTGCLVRGVIHRAVFANVWSRCSLRLCLWFCGGLIAPCTSWSPLLPLMSSAYGRSPLSTTMPLP